MNEYTKVDHAHKPLAYLRQRMALCKPEVVHCQVDTRQNDRHCSVAGPVFPVTFLRIDKDIGNAFEVDFTIVQHACPVHAHVGVGLIGCCCEPTDATYERLTAEIVDLGIGKRVAAAADSARSSYLFVDDKEVVLHETVFGGEHGNDILIELKAQKDDQHAEEIGKKEACKLRNTDVLA